MKRRTAFPALAAALLLAGSAPSCHRRRPASDEGDGEARLLRPAWNETPERLASDLILALPGTQRIGVERDGNVRLLLRALWGIPGVEVDLRPSGDGRGVGEVRVLFPNDQAANAHARILERLGDPDATSHRTPATSIDEDDAGWRRDGAKLLVRVLSAGGNALSIVLRVVPPATRVALSLADGSYF